MLAGQSAQINYLGVITDHSAQISHQGALLGQSSQIGNQGHSLTKLLKLGTRGYSRANLSKLTTRGVLTHQYALISHRECSWTILPKMATRVRFRANSPNWPPGGAGAHIPVCPNQSPGALMDHSAQISHQRGLPGHLCISHYVCYTQG